MKESNKYFSGELDSNIQYASREQGIKAFAETYSFNIESELYNQLTKEQQILWRKEIEQACISGGEMGVELAKDPRYKENLEVKKVDLEKEIDLDTVIDAYMDKNFGEPWDGARPVGSFELAIMAEHFFELGLLVSNKARKGE